MEPGFGQNLEGFLVKGNLSLAPSANPSLQGDGSIEGSGTLYFDLIREYNQQNGVNIQDVSFKNGQIIIPYTIPSDNITSASIVLDGGISIKHTQNATSISSGGGLTVRGGASIGKNVFIGGQLDVNNNKIVNVSSPILGTDGVNKDYVDSVASRVSGNFTTGQVIIADSVGDSIRGFDFFTTDTTQLTLSIPFSITDTTNADGTNAALIISGGLQISKDTVLGGLLDLSGNNIINVAEPINDSDATTKYYVDNLLNNTLSGNFTAGQLLVADSSGNTIRGYSNLTYDGITLTLSSTSASSFVCYGGVSIEKDVFIGGLLDVDGNNISNVATPILGTDAVNKDYVDSLITSRLSNFTAGQLIVADSSGTLRGYDNLTFNITDGTNGTLILNNYTNVILQSTDNASGLGSGGALTIYGGTSILKDVYIGGQLDVDLNNIKSVADPIDDYDAVNKAYVDNLISNINSGQGLTTNTFNLNNGVLIPEDIPLFYYPSSIKAFVANVYVHYNNTTTAFYTIYGIHRDFTWQIHSTYIGEDLGIDFYIRDNSGQGVLQYTNKNTTGFSAIRFSTIARIDNLESTTQVNLELLPNINTFTDISELEFPNNTIDSVKLLVYVSSESDAKYSLILLNVILVNGTWCLSSSYIGDDTGVKLNIRSTSTSGIIQYTNSNSSNDYTLRVYQDEFLLTQTQLTLASNTSIPTNIGTAALTFQGVTNFQLSIVVTVPLLNKSALFEIRGLLSSNKWKINSRYIGDYTGVKFYINTISGNVGVLQYTNGNGVEAYIRFIKNIPNLFEPLDVSVGGTGNSSLTPYAVLRGNGTSPIVATDDFIYKDYKLILGNESSIVLNNTSNATGLTNGGTFISNGGASFLKDVYIGGKLDVNLNNITSVADPIEDYDAVNKLYVDNAIDNIDLNNNTNAFEQTFMLNNSVVGVPQDIPGLSFPDTVRAFITNIYLESSSGVSTLYTLRGINCNSSWLISSSLIGDAASGVDFYIREDAGSGYVQYTNQNGSGSTVIKYTTSSLIYNNPSGAQVNQSLLPNTSTFTDIPSLTFDKENLDSIKLLVYVSSVTDDRYGLVLANLVLKNSDWIINTYNIGNVSGIKFGLRVDTNNIIVQYTNSNSSSDYVIRVINVSLPNTQVPIVLNANTLIPDTIDETQLGLPITERYFQLSIIVNVPGLNKSALYEIQGVVTNNIWNINYRYIGDYTGIRFYMNTVGGIGYLAYTNSNNVDANIKFVKDVPLTSLKPLQISRGGTGSTYLNPYTILRGNGSDPIIGTNDLIYENNTLILGSASTIILNNTSSAINLTTGSTFVAYGGVSINKELFIGQQLVVRDVDVTPNDEDISAERTFYAQNNVGSPSIVNGFYFTNDNTKSFSAMVCVTITTDIDEYDALFEIKGLKKRTGWIIDSTYIGDNTGIDFSIESNITGGQIQYTSTNMANWVSTTMKFRALTTSN